ncbi:alpha/beta hydrolase [Formosa sp. Hel1_33_131]|uniref:alpha/beta fold hydrolase n=1 Tax=Formosa sp. Hel1_33_131 TaxID=1336794 RepID=UPI00084E31D6|nr:alpha/beta hydrolase [Formosa sp. Hel1_33_131]AOR27484.1 alpha/beta hydrolase [Formosa sp. Hel1_33_131]
MKKILKTIKYSIITIVVIVLVFIAIVFIKSPGVADIVRNNDGNIPKNAISTIVTIPVGEIQQTIIIRGEDNTKPVLLFLHGGPGTPEFPFMKNIGLNLEQEFVVAYWEQRGAGKSYFKDIPVESMSLPQMISDAVEVSEYLQIQFKQNKIYLMGHSWGSFLGTMLAYQHPNHFHSYIGIGQVSHQYYGEKISLNWIKKMAKNLKNKSDVEIINTLVFPDSLADNQTWMDYLIPQRDFVNKYGGGFSHKNYNLTNLYKTILFDSPEYTFRNKINYLEGALFSPMHLWDDVIQTNLIQEVDSISIPVHIIQGIHDYQTPLKPAKDFFTQLKAPEKNFYQFDHSAHFPFIDEPNKFNKIIEKIVLGEN